jgi:hypothetical protein
MDSDVAPCRVLGVLDELVRERPVAAQLGERPRQSLEVVDAPIEKLVLREIDVVRPAAGTHCP